MSDPSNTLNPAIEKAIERALETAETAPCKICGREGAPPYPFAYGKTLETKSLHASAVVNTYSVEPGVAHICEECAAKYRRGRASKTRNQAIGAAVITVVMLVLGILISGDLREVFLIGAILPLIAAIWAFSTVRTLHRDTDRAGRWQAVELCKTELMEQGYDQFWSGPQ